MQLEFESLKDDLIKEYDRLGMRASGKTANSLEVQLGLDSVKLVGDKTFEQLEYGRGKSNNGSAPGKLIDAIKQWIQDKGIVSNIKKDRNNSTLAFLITRKIHRQGWKREKHGGVNLVSNIVTEKRIQTIIDKVGAELALTLVSRLQQQFKAVA